MEHLTIEFKNNEILYGQPLNDVVSKINDIIDLVSEGYILKEVISTDITPTTSGAANIFYLATEGTYTHFGTSIDIPSGSIGIFKWNGSAWDRKVAKVCDPVSVSQNTETGGYDLIIGNQSVNIAQNETITSIFSLSDIVTGEYIADNGTIVEATPAYRLVKFNLVSRRDVVISAQGNWHPILAKYTDDSYSVLDSIIIESGMDIFQKITLESGYYAMSWITSEGTIKDNYISNSPALLNIFSANAEIATLSNNVGTLSNNVDAQNNKIKALIYPTINSLFNYGDIIDGLYIKDNGTIGEAMPAYHLVKIQLSADYYLIGCEGNEHPILAKYNDADYTSLDTIIIDENQIGVVQKIFLPAGYYAFCWLGSYETNDNFISNSPILLDLYTKAQKSMNRIPFEGFEMKDIVVNGSSTKSGDIITLNGGGLTNMAYLDAPFYCARRRINGVFKTTATPDIIIGLSNGYLHIYNDTNNAVADVVEGGSVMQTHNFGFLLEQNISYNVSVEIAQADINVSIVVRVFSEYGIGEQYEIANIDIAANGYPIFASNSVTTLTKPFITNQYYYDIRNAKAAIFGHSFVEAWSIRSNRGDSFSNLVGKKLGRTQFYIFGHAGDGIDEMFLNIKSCSIFCKNIEYAMLCIGANDLSLTSTQFTTKLSTIIEYLTAKNIKPILFTISPTTSGYGSDQFTAINEWIRDSGYLYVDMDKVFYNNNGSIDTSIYTDTLHPNVDGHLRIFNRIVYDCPFLF